jgi:hypothetical protein
MSASAAPVPRSRKAPSSVAGTLPEKGRWWLITIGGYGKFGFFGTEKEAEEMRAHKAEWEGGVGRKSPIEPTHPQAVAERQSLELGATRGGSAYRKQLARIRRDLGEPAGA